MFRHCFIAVVLTSSLGFAASPSKAKKMTLVEQGVLVSNLLDVISGVSGLNIVLLDAPPVPKLDLKAEAQPWDEVLDDVVKRAGLAQHRTGNVVMVATAARLGGWPSAKYTGKRIRVALQDADVRDALELISRASNLELSSTEGTRPLTLKLKNVPADQMAKLLLALAEAKPAARKPPAPVTGCAAPKTPLARLKLTATTTGTADPQAVVRDENGVAWFVGMKGCLGLEKAQVQRVLVDLLVTNGTHDFYLVEGAIAHDSPKTEAVGIDALLTELDAPGALANTGWTGALAHKREVLRFLRDVVGLKEVDEPLPRRELTRLSRVQSDWGERVDGAIAGGLHAKPEVLAPFAAHELGIDGSVLLGCWFRLELGDRAAALQAVTALVTDLESGVDDELSLASAVEGKKVTVLTRPLPPSVEFLPAALGQLNALGVPPKDLWALDQRAKALRAHYAAP